MRDTLAHRELIIRHRNPYKRSTEPHTLYQCRMRPEPSLTTQEPVYLPGPRRNRIPSSGRRGVLTYGETPRPLLSSPASAGPLGAPFRLPTRSQAESVGRDPRVANPHMHGEARRGHGWP